MRGSFPHVGRKLTFMVEFCRQGLGQNSRVRREEFHASSDPEIAVARTPVVIPAEKKGRCDCRSAAAIRGGIYTQ
jgi:hypothetical protein